MGLKTMKTTHLNTCSAPICAEDTTSSELIWRPGEVVCTKSPAQPFQKKQREINKLFNAGKWKFHDPDDWFTKDDLEGKTSRRV